MVEKRELQGNKKEAKKEHDPNEKHKREGVRGRQCSSCEEQKSVHAE